MIRACLPWMRAPRPCARPSEGGRSSGLADSGRTSSSDSAARAFRHKGERVKRLLSGLRLEAGIRAGSRQRFKFTLRRDSVLPDVVAHVRMAFAPHQDVLLGQDVPARQRRQHLAASGLRCRSHVTFHGEAGVDAGGLTREMRAPGPPCLRVQPHRTPHVTTPVVASQPGGIRDRPSQYVFFLSSRLRGPRVEWCRPCSVLCAVEPIHASSDRSG